MELYVETLTGTVFELRVSPFETIISVKSKIQTLEGIPINQQHLIWNNMELEDNFCLTDYNIQDGATLKMVTAMRGGPINTRRIPMEDPAMREVADYMEANRDEIFEKLPNNRPVTLLVLKEGDIFNFFRVVDRGDGTMTPLSESLSGTASVCNLYEDDEEVEGYTSSTTALRSPTFKALIPKEKVEENDKTKQKMTLLRAKMDTTAMKKPKKKSGGFMPRPPSSHRPTSTRRLHRLSGTSTQRLANAQVISSFNRTPLLPPVGQQSSQFHPQESSKMPKISMHAQGLVPGDLTRSISRTELSRLLQQASTSASLTDVQQDAGTSGKRSARVKRSGSGKYHQRYIQPHYQLVQPPQSENTTQDSDTEANPWPPTTKSDNVNTVNTNGSLVLSTTGEVLKIPSTAGAEGRPLSDSKCTLTIAGDGAGSPMKCGRDSATQTENTDTYLAQRLESSLSLRGHTPSATGNGDEYPHTHPPPTIMEELPHTGAESANSSTPAESDDKHVTTSTNTESYHPVGRLNRQTSSPNSLEPSVFRRTQSPKVLQAGLIVTDNAAVSRGKSGLLRQISLERLGTSKLMSTSTSVTGIPMPTPPTTVRPAGMRGNVRAGLTSAGLTKSGKLRDNRMTDNRLLSARLQPVLSATQRLPPVKSKKKPSKKCFICAKKTGLATSFSCRCGNNFCSIHRYAEAHDCAFDYKSEGRALIEQNNPVVTAPKLPKI